MGSTLPGNGGEQAKVWPLQCAGRSRGGPSHLGQEQQIRDDLGGTVLTPHHMTQCPSKIKKGSGSVPSGAT